MASTVEIKVVYGTTPGTVEPISSCLTFLGSDKSTNEIRSKYPIRVPQQTIVQTSYERYFYVEAVSIDSGKQISNIRIYQATVTPQVGFTLYYKQVQSYSLPKNYTQSGWQVQNNYNTIPTSLSGVSNLGGTLTLVSDKTIYGVLILDVSSIQVTSCKSFGIFLSFDETTQPCTTPNNLSVTNPTNASGKTGSSLTPTLQWSATDANLYNLYWKISTQPTYNSVLNLTTTSYTFSTQLLESTQYSWYIRQFNTGSCSTSEQSTAPINFTTLTTTLPACPTSTTTLKFPLNGATLVGVSGLRDAPSTLDWSLDWAYTVYRSTQRLLIRKDVVQQYTSRAIVTPSTSVKFEFLQERQYIIEKGTKYYWKIEQVAGGDNCTSVTQESDEWTFTTKQDCTAPTGVALSTPANNQIGVQITNGNVTLTWLATGQTSYEIFMGTTAGNLSLVGTVATSSTKTFAVQNRVGGTAYYWKVVQTNGTGTCYSFSTSSSVFKFTTAFAPVTLFVFDSPISTSQFASDCPPPNNVNMYTHTPLPLIIDGIQTTTQLQDHLCDGACNEWNDPDESRRCTGYEQITHSGEWPTHCGAYFNFNPIPHLPVGVTAWTATNIIITIPAQTSPSLVQIRNTDTWTGPTKNPACSMASYTDQYTYQYYCDPTRMYYTDWHDSGRVHYLYPPYAAPAPWNQAWGQWMTMGSTYANGIITIFLVASATSTGGQFGNGLYNFTLLLTGGGTSINIGNARLNYNLTYTPV